MKYEVSPLAVEMMRWLIDHCAEPGYTAMKYEDFSYRRNEKREVEMKRDPLCHFD